MVDRKKRTVKIDRDRLFDIVNTLLLSLVLIAVLYPLYFIIIASVSHPDGIYQGKVVLLPFKFNLEGYKAIFNYEEIWQGYKNSILYTIAGVLINIFCTFTIAFPLSRKNLPGRGIITFVLILTLYFNGGLIPMFLLVRSLGLYDTMWALVLPPALSVMNVIIVRTFFQNSVPEELYESAVMDGCSNTRYFARILMPLSKSVVAVMVLFYGVQHWNSYFNALIFISDYTKYPLQLVLREILVAADTTRDMVVGVIDPESANAQMFRESIKYGLIIVSSLPVLLLYPFLQKYFEKGVMIGSLKG